MLKLGVKAEIQALSSFDFQYLTHDFLPRKLKEVRALGRRMCVSGEKAQRLAVGRQQSMLCTLIPSFFQGDWI